MGFCLVAYDVQSNKSRRVMSKLLEKSGTRLQRSVFVVENKGKIMSEIEKTAKDLLVDGDSFLVMPCCESCLGKARFTDAKSDRNTIHCAV